MVMPSFVRDDATTFISSWCHRSRGHLSSRSMFKSQSAADITSGPRSERRLADFEAIANFYPVYRIELS
jgi:hypothetical protein